MAAFCNAKGEISIRDIARRAFLKAYKQHMDPAYALEFSYSGPILISGGDDKLVNFFDYSRGRVVDCIESAHEEFVRVVRGFKTNPN